MHIISPKYDFVFAHVFGEQRNIDNTKGFLKTLLDIPEDDYEELKVENPILKRLFYNGKMGVVDLKISTKSRRQVHVELQLEKRANMRGRILYYAARLIGDQLHVGDDYSKIKEAVSIVICDHNLLEEEDGYINVYELKNEQNKRFTQLLKVIILELPKLPKEADSEAVWPWLRFFKCEETEEFEMLAKKYPELKQAVFCARKMSLLERWRNLQFHKNLWKVDERMLQEQLRIDGHAAGHAAGHAEGHAEGFTAGLTEVALRMKNRGRPAAEIAEDTGLSIETIEKL